MPKRIPAPPPLRPLAASLSPVVWAAFLPDLFDSFSAGLVFLQMCVPQLRGRKVMDPNGVDGPFMKTGPFTPPLTAVRTSTIY